MNFESTDPLNGGEATTGAFSPFGTPTTAGQVLAAGCRATEQSCGSGPTAARSSSSPGACATPSAWPSLRTAGSTRPITATTSGESSGVRVRDYLWRIEPGSWYGWPDFAGGRPFFDDDIRPVLANAPAAPPSPAAAFGVHSSADGFDFSRNEAFGHVGQAFVALFGDMSPPVGKVLLPSASRWCGSTWRTASSKTSRSTKETRTAPLHGWNPGGSKDPSRPASIPQVSPSTSSTSE